MSDTAVRSFQVGDLREKPFFTVDNRLVTEVMGKVDSDTLALFLFLLWHEENNDGAAMDYQDMADKLNVPLKVIVHGVAELMRVGILVVDPDGSWALGWEDADA